MKLEVTEEHKKMNDDCRDLYWLFKSRFYSYVRRKGSIETSFYENIISRRVISRSRGQNKYLDYHNKPLIINLASQENQISALSLTLEDSNERKDRLTDLLNAIQSENSTLSILLYNI
jgi:hypothetical protein